MRYHLLHPEAASAGERPGRNLARKWGSGLRTITTFPRRRGLSMNAVLLSLDVITKEQSVSEGTRPKGERGCLSACFICCDGYKGRAAVQVAGGSFSLTAVLPLSPMAT
jgi:hypothetical protein